MELKNYLSQGPKNNIGLFCFGGIGDQLLGLQCATSIYNNHIGANIVFYSFSRDEVFKVLKNLLNAGGIDNIVQVPEKFASDYNIIKDEKTIELIKGSHYEFYFICPDLLFRGPYSFNYKKYNTSPQIIKSLRPLLHLREESEKIIYCGLSTSTPQYKYHYTRELIRQLALKLPDYKIYFNNVSTWAGQEISENNLEYLPQNRIIENNAPFLVSLDWLRRSDYCVCLDNGISHIAYQMGIPRTLLSIRCNQDGVPWISRWYEDLTEAISYGYRPEDIAELVKTNIEIPQTTLLPRQFVISNLNTNWSSTLLFKF